MSSSIHLTNSGQLSYVRARPKFPNKLTNVYPWEVMPIAKVQYEVL